MNYTMNFKKLATTCLLSLSLASGITNASIFIKAYGGNSITTMGYDADYTNVNPAFDGLVEYRNYDTFNLFSFGFGLGFDTELHPKVSLGLELALQSLAQDVEVARQIPGSESALSDAGMANIEVKNKFKGLASVFLSINKAFYLKAGPSLLRQSVNTEIWGTNNPAQRENEKITKNHLGVTIGTGFIYKLSKSFGIFTEYNYSFYPRKKLGDNNIPAGIISASTGEAILWDKIEVNYAQSEFFLGFTYSFLNGGSDDSYRYRSRGSVRSTESCGKGPGRCNYNK